MNGKRFAQSGLATIGAMLIAGTGFAQVDVTGEVASFQSAQPNVGVRHHDITGRVTTVYGQSFSEGHTPEVSVRRFVERHGGMFGDIGGVDYSRSFDDPVFEVMWLNDEGRFRFMVAKVDQVVDGIPVFRGGATFTMRNEPGYPMVMARSTMRDLDGWRPGIGVGEEGAQPAGGPGGGMMKPGTKANEDQPPSNEITRNMQRQARKTIGREGQVEGDGELVIWAGVDELAVEPTLAVQFTMTNGAPGDADYDKRLFVADASTGEILYQESLILHVTDVQGNVGGLATEGIGADICAPESLAGLPYARVSIGGSSVFADVNGDFVIPNGGSSDVNVRAELLGDYFRVFDNARGNATPFIDLVVTPPGPANFVFNDANTSELDRANVNTYLHANVVRDLLLSFEPNYPTIATQHQFAINTNLNQNCNAFYDGSSINFFTSGGGCTNTGNSTVVYHEYGHHIVQMAGSGQGEYGEGMSDTVAMLVADDPRLGLAFGGNCNEPLRNADNTCQYDPNNCTSNCGSGIHACGRLISGCVWDLRENLFASDPSTYLETVRGVTFASILMRSNGDRSITPDETIAFLTADDDDGNIFNGTPHAAEILDAFRQHNMDPGLPELGFDFPSGRPASIDPAGGTSMLVQVSSFLDDPQPGTGMLHVDEGSGFQAIPMIDLGNDLYEAIFPAIDCGTTVRYFVSAETVNGVQVTAPSEAPAVAFSTVSAIDLNVAFDDNFETNQGWSVENVSLTDGAWARGLPQGGGDRGDPAADFDGSGRAYFTNPADGNTDVDGGPTRLISPLLDLTGMASAEVSYARWFFNDDGDADRLVVEVSDDGGTTWTLVESVADNNSGGWVQRRINVGDFVSLTDQVRFRFSATDNPNDSVTEAALDAFSVREIVCSNAATLVDLDVPFGNVVGGGLAEIQNSDGQLLEVSSVFGFSATEPNIVDVVVGAETGSGSPSTINLSVESRVDNPGGTSRLRLLNANTGVFEIVHEFPIGQTESVETVNDIDATNFVDGSGRIEFANRVFVVATFSASGFQAEWDQVIIEVE